MTEIFAKPAVGAIIEKTEGNKHYILIQERQKLNGGIENGMIELPAGKLREYENIFEALRREVMEETGLTITHISGEEDVVSSLTNGYETVSFQPFCITQNLSGGYSIILHTFLCTAEGDLLSESNETTNIRWIEIETVRQMLAQDPVLFYPMHINALYKYLSLVSDTLKTDRILLRSFEEKDLDDLYEYCSQTEVGENAGWPCHTSIETSKEVLSNFTQNKNQFAIVYRENNKVIGHICIHDDSENNREDTKELGYALNKDYWNRGIMTEVVNIVLDMLFKNGIENVYACCFKSNAASKHLIEKCGFTFEQESTYYAKPLNKTFESFEYIYTKSQWKAKTVFLNIQRIDASTRDIVTDFIVKEWGSKDMYIRGEVIDMSSIDGFVIFGNDNKIDGLITYTMFRNNCEIVSLNSTKPNCGIGTALTEKVRQTSIACGCKKLQLITTNDNLNAMGFYQKRGFELVGMTLGAIDEERKRKSEIPLIGQNGIPIHHEVAFEMLL